MIMRSGIAAVLLLLMMHYSLSVHAFEQDEGRALEKPWFVRDIRIGALTVPISPVTLVVLLWGLWSLLNAFQDDVYVDASHILLSKEGAEKTLKELKKKLKNDVNMFAETAKKYSECPSKRDGGSLGRFQRGTMAPPFDKAVFDPNTPIGTTIGPIQTQFGWHLIFVHKRQLE